MTWPVAENLESLQSHESEVFACTLRSEISLLKLNIVDKIGLLFKLPSFLSKLA